MRKRTIARELVLKILYQADIRKESIHSLSEEFLASVDIEDSQEIFEFVRILLSGVEKNLTEIDQKITQYASNWHLDRMAVIDRNVLRLGILELLYMEDIPSKVTINEAIELAKRFGDVESGKFVNGILDKALKSKEPSHEKPS
ncbi:MAG: transcription antitermination factor NusB [Candidatus Aceula meridiana]|nr:transcription antitermination factor NusB [Candidatus Aceula meridiana]